MEEKIIQQLNRIERYSLIAAKTILTIDEVAIITGLTKSWIYKATCAKKIPYYKPNGKLVYFDKKEIEDWMKQNRVKTLQEIEEAAAAYMTENTGTNGHKKGAKR